jgi:hypothetical protein
MRASVVILTGNHLCHNPRVIKESAALARAGYDVCILGGWSDSLLKKRDQKLLGTLRVRFVAVMDSTESTIRRLGARAQSKLGAVAHQLTRIGNRWQLGHAYSALGHAATREQADLFIAHSEPAMAVAVDLLRAGQRVGVDIEDWFSEDLLPVAQRSRPRDLSKVSFWCGVPMRPVRLT